MIRRFIEHAKWFHRKSQHYVMGNWYEYRNKAYPSESVKTFERGYVRAFIKFMWLSRYEIFKE